MRILHTADWHLEDRLGRVDRTDDIRRGVERVAAYCEEHQVDVLLMAGDLFAEKSLPLVRAKEALQHLQKTFTPFLRRGGTVLAITGNHDSETICETLREAMALAAPDAGKLGGTLPAGRFYLAHDPFFGRIENKHGMPVQFVLLPYPTSSRYLDASITPASREELHVILHDRAAAMVQEFRDHSRFKPELRTVLAAHLQVQGSQFSGLYKMSEREDVLFKASDLPIEWDYLALGHIHRPQMLMNLPHVRYPGGVERLNLGERDDPRGCLLIDLDENGRRGDPLWLPLDARPIYQVAIRNPQDELPQLRDRFPDAAAALVKLDVVYRSSRDNRQAILEELERVFPRWYERTVREESRLRLNGEAATGFRPGFAETVTGYVKDRLEGDADLPAVLGLLDELLLTEESA
jgi:DNA repair protein SbcD/Mre11